MIASPYLERIQCAASATAVAVSRPVASARICRGDISGACLRTQRTSAAAVTTRTRERPTRGTILSYVRRNRLAPPSSDRNGLGILRRASGHNRVPPPPARITATGGGLRLVEESEPDDAS